MSNFYSQVAVNKRKSLLVVVGFIFFITASVYAMSLGFGFGLDFVGLALIASGVSSFISYYFSDKIILSISGAKKADKNSYFDYYTVVENLAMSQRLPMPQLYVLQDTAMNAFATGRSPKSAVICATTGLLDRLDRTEIEGVMAHELAHIKNFDIRLMSIVTVLVGLVSLLADWFLRMSWSRSSDRSDQKNFQVFFIVIGLVLAILSPIIAQLIQLAISRRREFLADATAAAMTKYPIGLARALQKISKDTQPLEAANKATAHLYIANPLKNHHDAVGMFANLFNTHPPIQERIKALTK